ncbi:hypothetical protein ABPG75_004285 [Micractinium tetrahymenae]
MDWQDDAMEGEEGALAVDKAFTLISEAPSPVAARQHKHKGSGAASEVARIERGLTLEAYPPRFEGEPEAARLARAAAATACWDALAANIQETLDGTDAGVFQELLAFAQASHAAAQQRAAAPSAADVTAGCQQLPAALVLAGGVNSADHCTTFPALAAFLRQHGCCVALMQPASFGKVPGDAVSEVLRQVSGLATSRADDLSALVQWYRDETGGLAAAAGQVGHQGQQQEGGSESDDSADEQETAAGQPEGRRLRQRPAAGGATAVAAAAAAAAQQAANRQRPLVVVVENTEGVDVQCLRDFVVAASEAYAEVPLTLMLGLTTTAAALSGMLPSDIMDRCMQLRQFKLASAMARLDSLVQRVLLGGSGHWPGLRFSQPIVSQLADIFLNHYYSTGSIRQGLQLAALSHFEAEPLSALAAAALGGREALQQACAKLDPKAEMTRRSPVRLPPVQARKRLGRQVADAVWQAMQGWSRWAVGLQWLLAAAEAAGLQAQEFRPWKLVELALGQRFAWDKLKDMLGRLQPRLRHLSTGDVEALAWQLQQRAAAVWGGEEAAAEELQSLAALAAGGAGQHQQERQQVEERQQAGATAAAAAPQAEAAAQHAKKLKNDRFHSRASRNAALLQKSQQQAAAKGGRAATAAAAAAQAAAAPGAQLAAWLADALHALLSTPPTKLPGAVVFTCRNADSLNCLTAEPRAALHMALSEPHSFLQGLPEELGLSASQEDACLAYRLLDQDPDCANLADWYQAFVAVHSGQGQEAGGSGGSTRKKAAVKTKGSRGRGKKAAAAEAAAEGGGAGGAGATMPAQQARTVAARFSQAAAELQYVGLIKPAKRRRGNYVQRMAHMPALEV